MSSQSSSSSSRWNASSPISSRSRIARTALRAARQAVLAMRDRDEIGDDAFHRLEEELDWLDMAAGVDE